MTIHTYAGTVTWTGRTTNYDGYRRDHHATAGQTSFPMSADAAFRGDAALPNPEQLLVVAPSSCQLLSFLAVAALAGVEVTEYSDTAEGIMTDDERPMRLSTITLRPRIIVQGSDVDRVERLVQKAHRQCYIANSLTTNVVVEPTIVVE